MQSLARPTFLYNNASRLLAARTIIANTSHTKLPSSHRYRSLSDNMASVRSAFDPKDMVCFSSLSLIILYRTQLTPKRCSATLVRPVSKCPSSRWVCQRSTMRIASHTDFATHRRLAHLRRHSKGQHCQGVKDPSHPLITPFLSANNLFQGA